MDDTSIFAPLAVPPAPSATRLPTGAPGPKYWQNRADYDLKATLDTVAGTVQGSMVLRYTNHSPNTLDFLWFQTEQNASRPDSANSVASRAHAFGDVIDQFAEVVDGQPAAVQLEDDKTETKVTLPRPLAPGETATFTVVWHFIVPTAGGRMGRERSLYQVAQWYPRLNVYDDVKGWNIEPYLGQGEFYLEYGDFTLAVTVPSNEIVAATGTLDNPDEVLTPTEIARLKLAMAVDTIVHVATVEELRSGAAHPRHDGMVTWKFHAHNVRDAVWCASPAYIWDATHWQGILVQSFYRPQSAPFWSHTADMARMSIQEYSERWYPYPYPQVSATEGPVYGMEYPMLSMDGDDTTAFYLYDTITHETGHNWFPMIVGSNERMHTWMDEGFNQFINTFSNARRYPEQGDQVKRGENIALCTIERALQRHNDARVEVPADSATRYGYVGYYKPAGILEMLRHDVMGPALFDKGLRTYVERWAYKHPTPEDFFRPMEDVSGEHLDWFWREWFFETPSFDQAIDSVDQTAVGGETHVTVVYGNHARGVMPILARFTFSDGTTQDVKYPADVWRANSTRYVVSYTFWQDGEADHARSGQASC